MGLFSKHKSSDSTMPPAPPSASLNSIKESSQGSSMSDLPSPPMPEMSKSGNLSPPPIPGGNSLDDIKEQVSYNNNNSNNAMMNNQSNDSSFDSQGNDSNSFDSSSDSLFDDMFSTDEEHQEDVSKKSDNSQRMQTTNNGSAFDITEFDNSESLVDTSMERSDSLGFVRGGHYNSHSGKDSCFLTTSQFKALLEIVEGVKSKVKDSTEIHLRLMDIKSEEDIEYENLRKNFAQMEDKLYELDTILFEEDK